MRGRVDAPCDPYTTTLTVMLTLWCKQKRLEEKPYARISYPRVFVIFKLIIDGAAYS